MRPGERAEILTRAVRDRFDTELTAALRRKLPSEGRLAGALRALFPVSPALRKLAGDATLVLLRRGSFDRELYGAMVRGLAETGEKRASAVIAAALAADQAGGLPTLSAACSVSDGELEEPLARVAGSRHAHLAFGAEVARIARGESTGAHLAALAPKIKESHRIALCLELLLPLTRAPPLPRSIGPALAVLRDAERHLGRWLVMAEIAVRAGDPEPLAEARARGASGPESSRLAWSLVAWALEPSSEIPPARPTVEMVARLSDRPSADRDTTFLFRLAQARAPATRPMLEALAKVLPLPDEVAIRAAMHLAKDHGKGEMRKAIWEAARGKREELRGVAAAALWDIGERDAALEAARALETAKAISGVTWAALVHAAAQGTSGDGPVLAEPTFRRVQWGWVE